MKKLYLEVLFLASAIVAGCSGDSPVAEHQQVDQQPLVASVPPGVVQSAIQQGPVASDGSITFSVRVLANQVGVSAYQGAVTFAPGAFELVSADPPASAGGEGHLINTNDFAQGRIRFAAFTPTTFRETTIGDGVEALRITVRPLRPIDDANLVATLDVVSGETGVSVQPARLLSSQGIIPSNQ